MLEFHLDKKWKVAFEEELDKQSINYVRVDGRFIIDKDVMKNLKD